MEAVNPGRYHLTLIAASVTMMHGWWGSETTARRQFSTWVGERGTLPSARITLTDEETGTVLATWPAES
ncbi:hypothetical protein [Streptomyces sp. NPDC058755]|uniref:hypothetical protein n=1 Tax=Streptomyces sp. NPDC058755 TaxID=3346624 RepID=UPI0036938126